MTRSVTRRSAPAPHAGELAPRLILLGDKQAADAVRPALSTLRVDIEWLPEIALPSDGVESGVVLISLDGKPRPIPAIQTLRTLTDVPIFAVVSDGASDRAVRRLYEAGAAAVFEWPLEGLMIGRFIAEILALRFVRGRATQPDQALARIVRSHLKLLPGLTAIPTIEVHAGVVALTGQVDSLPLRLEVERCVASVPGVRSLDLSDLKVVPEPVPAARILRAARRLVESSADLDASTLALALEEGQLVIEGSVPSAQVARLLEERAAGIAGLRGIENRTHVSQQEQRADHGAARRLRNLLQAIFPDAELGISFFDGTAVLTGEVDSLRKRRDIVQFVSDDAAVERVIDKLEVGS